MKFTPVDGIPEFRSPFTQSTAFLVSSGIAISLNMPNRQTRAHSHQQEENIEVSRFPIAHYENGLQAESPMPKISGCCRAAAYHIAGIISTGCSRLQHQK